MRTQLLLLALALPLAAAEDVPTWVREAASATLPELPPRTTRIVLLHEESVTVDANGNRSMREREVVRVVEKDSDPLMAHRAYNVKTGSVRDFRGWVIVPSRRVTSLGKKEIGDIAAGSELYDEVRIKVMSAGELEPGSVFAYEVAEEEKSIFSQYQHAFQDSRPVLLSRFVLTLPPRWEARGTLFNYPQLEPVAQGQSLTWELRNLPRIEAEEHGPQPNTIAPRLGVSFFPDAPNKKMQPLKDWAAVSEWTEDFVDPASAVTPAIQEKANSLSSGSADELSRIRSLARFVQETQYVSVQMNVTRGGGYTPHSADQVLSRNYGDCKDKAALLRALLKAVNVDSHMVMIRSGDRRFVKKEWPSTLWFNHAIVAIRLKSPSELPAVVNDEKLGRLLLFDPTDSETTLGELPIHEQGGYALVVAGANGRLVQAPYTPMDLARVESAYEGDLNEYGTLLTSFVRRYYGQSASRLRGAAQGDLKRYFERSMARRLGGLSIQSIAAEDKAGSGRLDVNMKLSVDHFAQNLAGRMLMVRPGILAPPTSYSFSAKQRRLPIRIESDMRKDSVEIRLPAGFQLDEIPDPMQVDSPYGSFQASWKVEGSQLRFEQSVALKETEVPPGEYEAVRQFFAKLHGAQAMAVVLTRK